MVIIKKDKKIKNILYNVLYLFLGNIVTKLLGAVATMIYIRYSAIENYGILSVALSLSTICLFFTDAGISQTTIREGTKKEADLPSIMYSYVKVRMLLLVVVMLCSMVLILILYKNEPVKKMAILVFTVPTLFGGTLQGIGIIYFQIIEKMKKILIINIVSSIGMTLALFVGVYFKFDIISLCFGYAFSNVLVGAYAILLVRKEIRFRKDMNAKIFDQLFVFSINAIISMMIPQVGPLILDKILTAKDLGYYAAAFKIPSVLYQFPGVVAAAFYPRLFQLGNEKNYIEHRSLSSIELKIMSILGAMIALPFIVAPKFWLVLLLTENLIPATPALVLLSYLIFLQAIKYPLADFLTTIGRQKGRTIITFIGLIVSIIMYLVLGNRFGLVGGAAAPVLAELVIIIGCILLIPKGMSYFIGNMSVTILFFGISILVYNLILKSVYPIVGITIIEIIFMTGVVFFQKDIRNQINIYIKLKLNH